MSGVFINQLFQTVRLKKLSYKQKVTTSACLDRGMAPRRGGRRSFSLSDSDHSEGEQSLLTLNAPRRQSLGFGVTHCPLPYVREEEEENEDKDEQEGEGGNESRCESESAAEVRGEEGYWAWLVVFSSFICLCVLDGVSYTFGMFLQPLTDDLGIPLGATSMVGSLQVGRQHCFL